MKKQRQVVAEKREREGSRENRERVRLLYAVPGSGVLIRWKEVLSCWWMHEEETIEGAEGRQSSHLALKRRLRASFHSSFLLPPFILLALPPSVSLRSFLSIVIRLSVPFSRARFARLRALRRLFRPSSGTYSPTFFSPPRSLRVCPPR